jgi:hypothetical protein
MEIDEGEGSEDVEEAEREIYERELAKSLKQ